MLVIRHAPGITSKGRSGASKLNSFLLGIEITLFKDGLYFIYLESSFVIYNNMRKVIFPLVHLVNVFSESLNR